MNIFDRQPLSIKCPTCGKQVNKTVGWFKKAGQSCPFKCGATFDTKKFRRGVEKAEDAFAKFTRKFGKIGLKF